MDQENKLSQSVTERKEGFKILAIFLFFTKIVSFSINIMLDSPFACLSKNYGLYLSPKGFELVATFKSSKYSFLYLLSLTTKLRCFLHLDKSAGN